MVQRARVLASVGADAVAEAALRTMDRGHDLAAEGMRERFRPWFRLIASMADGVVDLEIFHTLQRRHGALEMRTPVAYEMLHPNIQPA